MSAVLSLARPSSSSLTTAVSTSQSRALQQSRRVLPNPFAPHFPQTVFHVDGSTFTHYTTSPRSLFKLTKDTTNTPLWNATRFLGEAEEEDAVTGRLGRFNRRFEGLGGSGSAWLEQADTEEGVEALKKMQIEAQAVMGTHKQEKEDVKKGKGGKRGKR
ncbi:hypothetical protein EVJ58_g3652 [Rhodofomes roseus]|uniref:Uncharacterized protein n=1 Tax=Rhodofomes roseus TaxID=34475 RepID=A0A4Y9YLC7_9APHY|nr:hypothetical protein EVJ58_g3652 [Rhodofomes roseus]